MRTAIVLLIVFAIIGTVMASCTVDGEALSFVIESFGNAISEIESQRQ